MQRAQSLLLQRYPEKLSLEELALVAGLSKFHFLRLFRSATGLTPCQYQRQLRIEAAKLALHRGESPSQVALDCGFVDQSHFTRAFRVATGLTPGQFVRAAHRMPRSGSGGHLPESVP